MWLGGWTSRAFVSSPSGSGVALCPEKSSMRQLRNSRLTRPASSWSAASPSPRRHSTTPWPEPEKSPSTRWTAPSTISPASFRKRSNVDRGARYSPRNLVDQLHRVQANLQRGHHAQGCPSPARPEQVRLVVGGDAYSV